MRLKRILSNTCRYLIGILIGIYIAEPQAICELLSNIAKLVFKK